MPIIRKKKCKHCHTLFRPDPRTHKTQRFCSNADCKKVSKIESQQRWLRKAENKDYFQGEHHVQRVRQWRKKQFVDNRKDTEIQNVSFCCEQQIATSTTNFVQKDDHVLQEMTFNQPVENKGEIDDLNTYLLQEMRSMQPIVLLGLITHLTNSTLQDEIASTTSRLQQLGLDILHVKRPIGENNDLQQVTSSRAGACDTQTI